MYGSAFQANVSASLTKYFHKAIILHYIQMCIKFSKGFLLWVQLLPHTAHHGVAVLPVAAAAVSLLPTVSPFLYLPT